MNTPKIPRVASLHPLLLCFVALLPSKLASASDLEVSIRPHVRRVFFGDPLYVQVTIVNRSERVVTGPTPRLDGTNFVFYVYDPNKDSPDSPVPQVAVGGPVSVAKTVQFDQDNDDDQLVPVAGWSEHQGTEDPTNFVFYETARDMHAQPYWPDMVDFDTFLDRVSAHEALHRFFGWHGTDATADEGIMHGPTAATAASITLTSGQIRIVQKTRWPK